MHVNVVTHSSELEIFVHNYPDKRVSLFSYTKNLGEIERVLTYVLRFVAKCKEKYTNRPTKALEKDELEKDIRKYVPFPTTWQRPKFGVIPGKE